jgi:hypothetical protein
MKRTIIGLILWANCIHPASADPAVVREASGLRLIAYRYYEILSPGGTWTKDESSKWERLNFCRSIVALVENCGATNITVPTYPKGGKTGIGGGGSYRITPYYFGKEVFAGRLLVLSPVVFQPVTLAPGQTTELEAQRDLTSWTVDIQKDKPVAVRAKEMADDIGRRTQKDAQVRDYVKLDVAKELADQYGWWSGHLCVPIEPEEKSPNKPSEPTPASDTPAATAPVAPPSGAAHS